MKRARQADHRRPGQAARSSWWSPPWPPACSWSPSATSTSARTSEYKAEFIDATGVVKGDDIRIAGVKVGTVKDIEIVDRTRAMVTFSVQDDDRRCRKATRADIRYRNLVGQRYISLTNEIGDSAQLARGRHHPGRPDLAGPRPDGAVQRLQAAVPGALARATSTSCPTRSSRSSRARAAPSRGCSPHTASVTSTLADRDQIISALIDNLNEVLDHIGSRDDQLNQLITTFRTFVGGLKDDRQAILGSLDQISDAVGADRRPGRRASASRSSRTSSSCAPSPGTSTATRPSSTGRCRCCRSSSRRSAGPRSTARGSTSTSASSRARSPSPA